MINLVPAELDPAAGLEFPTMYEAHRVYRPEEVPEIPVEMIPTAVKAELSVLRGRIKPGERVAIATGSRGIANFVALVRAAGEAIREAGGEPFLLPAMGSHGGATAEGQREVLEGYGLTFEATGMEIISDMAVREVGRLPSGMGVYVSVTALEADHVLLLNRIKPHTDWRGPIESGLAKICTIGLGKQPGAESIHRNGIRGLAEYMVEAARMIIERTGKVIGGLATLENAYEHTASVHWVEPEGIGGPAEAELQARSKRLLATLPFDDIDVLIVDEIGKNIAGPGMDTNVVGRVTVAGAAQFERPRITIIAALDLTPESHGNAVGLGIADVTTVRMLEKVDWQKVWMNAYTSGVGGVLRARVPMPFPTDRDAVAAAIRMCGVAEPALARVVRIKNTLEVAHLQLSASLLEEAAERGLRVEASGVELRFDSTGRLVTAPAGSLVSA